MKMVDQQGQEHEIPEDQVQGAFQSGQYGFQPGAQIPVQGEDGQIGTVPAEQYDPRLTPVSQLDYDAAAREEKYGGIGGAAATAGINAADALALGFGKGIAANVADAFGEEGAGQRTREAIQAYDATNPASAVVGQVAGIAAPMALGALPGLAGKAARGVGMGVRGVDALGGVAERGIQALVGTEAESVLGRLGQKAAGYGARGAVEGAVYGTGGAYSTATLENEDLTAERMMTGAEHGALFGGVVGGALGAGSSLLESAATKVVPKIREAVENFAEERALKAAGASKKWMNKALDRAGGPEEVAQDLLARGHIQAGGDVRQVAKSIDADVEATGAKLGKMMRDLDESAGGKGVSGDSILKRAEQDVIKPLYDNPATRDVAESLAKRLEPFANDFAGKQVGHEELWNIRRALDDRIKWDSRAANPVADGLKDFRRVLEDELVTSADKTAAEVGLSDTFAKDWKETKRVYSSMRFAQDMATDAVSGKGGNRFLSLTDNLAGGFGASAFASGHAAAGLSALNPGAALAGVLTAAAHKVLRERGSGVLAVAAQKLAKVGQVAEQAHAVDQQIGKAVDQFLSRGAAKMTDVGAMRAPEPANMNKVAQKGDLDKRYDSAVAAIGERVSKPQKAMAQTAEHLAPLTDRMPGLAQKVQEKRDKATAYLQEQLPPQRSQVPLDPVPNFRQSDTEKAKLVRTTRAIERPMSVVEDLKDGKLSRESIKALQAALPATLEDLRKKTLDGVIALAEKGKAPSYEQRLLLGRLLGRPVDPTQTPQFRAGIKKIFDKQVADAKPPEGQGGQSTGSAPKHKLDTARALETRADQLERMT